MIVSNALGFIMKTDIMQTDISAVQLEREIQIDCYKAGAHLVGLLATIPTSWHN